MSTSFPPIIHMFSTGRFRRAVSAFVAAATLAQAASARPAVAGAQAAPADNATLFRVFLRDGSTLVSYGEYARVADRVVVTLPVGAGSGGSTPDLEVLSIPADT